MSCNAAPRKLSGHDWARYIRSERALFFGIGAGLVAEASLLVFFSGRGDVMWTALTALAVIVFLVAGLVSYLQSPPALHEERRQDGNHQKDAGEST